MVAEEAVRTVTAAAATPIVPAVFPAEVVLRAVFPEAVHIAAVHEAAALPAATAALPGVIPVRAAVTG